MIATATMTIAVAIPIAMEAGRPPRLVTAPS